MKRKISFRRQLIFFSMAGFFIMAINFIYYSYSTVTAYFGELERSNALGMNLYMNELTDVMDDSENFLYSIALDNRDFINLQFGNENLNEYLAAYNLLQVFNSQMNIRKGMDGLFLIYRDGHMQQYKVAQSMDFRNVDQVKKSILTRVRNGEVSKEWYVAPGADRSYLVRIIGGEGVYVAAMIDFERLTENISAYEENGTRFVYFYNNMFNSGKKLDSRMVETLENFRKNKKNKRHGAFFIYSGAINHVDMEMYMVMKNNQWSQLKFSQIYALLMTVLCCILLPFFYHQIKKRMLIPFERLIDTMNLVKAGNMDAKVDEFIPEFAIEEFDVVNRTFNSMMEEIKNLKLDAYEEKLEKEKIKLQYLQLQIKPHFFLNCLKTLYAMSNQKQYTQMNTMIISISGYFRYLFKENSMLVTLNEEINFTKNYIELIRNNTQRALEYDVDADAEAMMIMVPPLIIQTFVENSVKYSETDILKISIRVRCLHSENGKLADFIIKDNGQGYSEQMLESLNNRNTNNTGLNCEEGHVGIYNLRLRSSMIFGAAVEYCFYNQQGAVSEVILPKKMEGEPDEHTGG